MGLFDLFKKDKKEVKTIYAPIKCIINMFQDGEIILTEDGKSSAYIFDKEKYNSLDTLIQNTILKYEADYIEILGYGSDELDDAIDSVKRDELYLDGEGEYWQLSEK